MGKGFTRKLSKLVLYGGLLLLLISMAAAQITTTTIVGTVTDNTGAIIPNAQVTARNTGTNFARTAQTDAQGQYRIEFLPVGNYVVEVTAPGFNKFVRSGIVLAIGQTARIDAPLKVGSANETVNVDAALPQVDTSNSTVGQLIENHEIMQLPIVDRNLYTLLDLTPGVQSNQNSIVLGYPEQRTMINGGVDAGAGSVNYYLDGGINMTGIRNTGNILPNPDAVQEFRVQTNNYSAEFGRYAGGVINVLTKSGTNKFHGSLFEFLRNNMFNANDWRSVLPTPPLHRNQFGGTIGGPIVKDKTFFFFSYAGLRQNTSTFMSSAVVPTALERTGDFTQSKVIPNDPLTKKPFQCNGVVGVICPNRLDPAAMKIIGQYIPQSNVTGNGWQGTIPNPYNTNEVLFKVDHQLNNAHRITATYFETSGINNVRAGSGNLPWSIYNFNWRQHEANLSDTWTISSTKINQVWLNYTRNFGGRLNVPDTSLADLGSTFTPQGTPSLPDINVTGYFHLTNAIGGPKTGTNFYSVRDVFSMSKGRHALKFGAEMSLDKDIQQVLLNNYGVFSFNGSMTKNALADFEIGIPNSLSQDAPINALTNSWYYGFFVQDDFRIHPRFTLNLGLRWDIQTPPTDPHNREVTWVPGVQSTVNPTAPVGLLFAGDAGVTRGVVPIRWHHVSPRIGFAWDPFGDGKTSIRGAVGVFFGSVSGNQWNTMTNFEPFSVRLKFTNSGSTTGATLSNPYRGLVGGNPFPYNGSFLPGGSIFVIDKNFQWPYSYQLNFSIQRQVTNSLAVSAAYVGNFSHDLPFAQDVNYPVLTPTATSSGSSIQARRPDQSFGSILMMQSNQTANYNGLQLTASQRMSHHLTFHVFYTFSKTLDSVQLQNNTTQGGAQNMANLAGDHGRADTDQRHIFVASFVYRPDYYNGGNRLLKNIVNGWSIAPIVKLHSGSPFSVLNGLDANLDGNSTDRAQLVGDPNLGNPSAAEWFNTAAFARNPAVTGVATDGNSARNLLTGPDYKDVDLALSRIFQLGERMRLEFRGEATNAFNFVDLNNPGSTVGTSTFGKITSAKSMRQIQLGLRLTF